MFYHDISPELWSAAAEWDATTSWDSSTMDEETAQESELTSKHGGLTLGIVAGLVFVGLAVSTWSCVGLSHSVIDVPQASVQEMVKPNR